MELVKSKKKNVLSKNFIKGKIMHGLQFKGNNILSFEILGSIRLKAFMMPIVIHIIPL